MNTEHTAMSKKVDVALGMLRQALVVVPLITGALTTASCTSLPRQTEAERRAVLSAIRVGQRVEVAYIDPNGRGSSGSDCSVDFINSDGFSCGSSFIFPERVISMRISRSGVADLATIPIIPVAITAWVALEMVCPSDLGSCGLAKGKNASKDVDICDVPYGAVPYADYIREEKSARVIRVPANVSVGTKYQADDIAETVEIVTWNSGEMGRSHFEADGEVIYLVDGSPDIVLRTLLMEAIEYKVLVRNGLNSKCGGQWTRRQ
jgi:hypothetical protein